jgi:hypothetical protein
VCTAAVTPPRAAPLDLPDTNMHKRKPALDLETEAEITRHVPPPPQQAPDAAASRPALSKAAAAAEVSSRISRTMKEGFELMSAALVL